MAGKEQRGGAAPERVLSAALNLFSRHGVSGTSLQMIADELGVTKAAVYHRFQSKEEIVWAVVAPALERLAEVAREAEAQPRRSRQVGTALAGVVDLVVEHRRVSAIILTDPAVSRLVRGHPVLYALEERINRVLAGPEPDAETLVGAAMLSGGLMAAGLDPRLADLDDDTLRRHLLDTARRLMRLRPLPRARTATEF
ncbi:TetR/AcrR family transcriptional regulator [Spirillospora sp. NPDC048823]|uniref:TetR/AcrR family transcriptional regulator n=1 Tax=unclassified Spirillospora TaxID=2642701 RepID=UPI00371CB97E